MKLRYIYIILTAFLILICITIVLFFKSNNFIRGFIDDIIIVILIFSFLKSLKDFNSLLLAVFVLIFAFLIEFAQLFKLIDLLGLQHNFFAQIIIGSTFDLYDLLAYLLGIIIIFTVDKLIFKTNLCSCPANIEKT
jgi:hypothetical protein